jgi:hypothetical protein
VAPELRAFYFGMVASVLMRGRSAHLKKHSSRAGKRKVAGRKVFFRKLANHNRSRDSISGAATALRKAYIPQQFEFLNQAVLQKRC